VQWASISIVITSEYTFRWFCTLQRFFLLNKMNMILLLTRKIFIQVFAIKTNHCSFLQYIIYIAGHLNNVYIGNGWSWMSHKQFTHNTIEFLNLPIAFLHWSFTNITMFYSQGVIHCKLFLFLPKKKKINKKYCTR
jgi:hypothetical protein